MRIPLTLPPPPAKPLYIYWGITHRLMSFKKITLTIFILGSLASPLSAQTNTDTVIAATRIIYQRINSDKSLRLVRLDEDELSGENTDNGGELQGYFKGDSIHKMVLVVGLSYAIKKWEYYFSKERVVFIFETERDFPEDSGGLNVTKTVLAFEGRYYYYNGMLIRHIFKGKKRLADNNTAAYIRDLPESAEIDRYIRLLKKKAK